MLINYQNKNSFFSYYNIKKCFRHFIKNLWFFTNLCSSGEVLSYKVKKNPACRIFRLRQVAQRYAPLRRNSIIAFYHMEYSENFPYGKKYLQHSMLHPSGKGLSYIGFGRQKVCLTVALGRWYKKILSKCLLYDGEETQKSWKPILNTIFVLRGLSKCSIQWNSKTSFAAQFFCVICQVSPPDRPFDTRILYGKKYV